MTLRLQRKTSLAGAGLPAAALLLTACGGGTEEATTPQGNGAPAAPQASTAAGAPAADLNYAGTLREPAATPRPAANDGATGVGRVIEDALRAAGLMR